MDQIDRIDVRELAVPALLADALDDDFDARRSFASLSYAQQLRYVRTIEEAKTAAAQRRRTDKALVMLRDLRG